VVDDAAHETPGAASWAADLEWGGEAGGGGLTRASTVALRCTKRAHAMKMSPLKESNVE